jgi:flagellar basal body-associated protein FliL
MIRIVLIGLWICAVALGSLFFTVKSQAPASEKSGKASYLGGMDYATTDVFSVPVMTGGAVAGYVIAQFVYTIDEKAKARLTVPMEYFIKDEIFRQFYGAYSDTKQVEKVNFETVKKSVIDGINRHFPEPVVRDLLVQQFTYMSSDEIREMNMKGIGKKLASGG